MLFKQWLQLCNYITVMYCLRVSVQQEKYIVRLSMRRVNNMPKLYLSPHFHSLMRSGYKVISIIRGLKEKRKEKLKL